MPYEICVGDNFQAPHPQTYYSRDRYATAEEALARAKKMIERDLLDEWVPGRSPGEVYDRYITFGESVLMCHRHAGSGV